MELIVVSRIWMSLSLDVLLRENCLFEIGLQKASKTISWFYIELHLGNLKEKCKNYYYSRYYAKYR
jgi:hypothetical protein